MVGLHRVLPGQQAAGHTPRLVDRLPFNHGIRPCKIDVFKDTQMRPANAVVPNGMDLAILHIDDLTRLDFPFKYRVYALQRTGLRGEHHRVSPAPHA